MMAKRWPRDLEYQPGRLVYQGGPTSYRPAQDFDFAERFGRLIECQAGWEASSRLGRGPGLG